MGDRTYNYIKYNNGSNRISDNAYNYDVKKESMDPSYINIFEYYDKNGDNNLDTTELAILKKDINEANSNKVKQNLNKNKEGRRDEE